MVEFSISEDMLRYHHSDLRFTSDPGASNCLSALTAGIRSKPLSLYNPVPLLSYFKLQHSRLGSSRPDRAVIAGIGGVIYPMTTITQDQINIHAGNHRFTFGKAVIYIKP